MTWRWIAKVIFLLCVVTATRLVGATWHVSSHGTGPGDGSPAAPFGQIQEALAAAEPGDTVVVQAGKYPLHSSVVVTKPRIRLTGVAGERPMLLADGAIPAAIIVMADDVVLQDLVIQGGFYGVKLDVAEPATHTRGILLRQCQIGSTGADCVKSYNADQLTIELCRLGPSGSTQKDNAEGIDVVGSLGVIIRNCVIEDVATNGVYLKGGTRDGVIERCLIRRCGHAGILLGQDTDAELMRNGVANEALDCVARNNIIVSTRMAGLGTYSGKHVGFFNNTLVDVATAGQAGFWVVTNSRGIPAEDVQFCNNIVAVGGDRPAVFVKDAASLPTCDNNLFHAMAGRLRFVREIGEDQPGSGQWTFEQWRRQVGQDQASIEAEAMLDAMYRPAPASQAIGAGLGIKGISDDYFGRRRPAGTMDIGAVCAKEANDPARAR